MQSSEVCIAQVMGALAAFEGGVSRLLNRLEDASMTVDLPVPDTAEFKALKAALSAKMRAGLSGAPAAVRARVLTTCGQTMNQAQAMFNEARQQLLMARAEAAEPDALDALNSFLADEVSIALSE